MREGVIAALAAAQEPRPATKPFVPMFTMVFTEEARKVNHLPAIEREKVLDDLTRWYVHFHTEHSNEFTLGDPTRDAAGVTLADRLARRLSPLRTDPDLGVALAMSNHLGIAPGEDLRALGEPHQVMLDLFGLRPADYAIAGGSWGLEGEAAQAAAIRHNVLIAGTKAAAVDVVAAAVMAFDPARLPFLALAEKRGFGGQDIDATWTRGNEIEEARRPFRKPARWAETRS